MMQTIVAIDCTFTHLTVRVRELAQAIDLEYTLNVNGVDTVLTCAMTASTTSPTLCSGTTPVAVNAGDLISIKFTASQATSNELHFGLVCGQP